ncbi:MAG: aminopeptidase [Deltaproteobacteria bacterium]|nr:aminopeptidase [Deltaproteobacteria bacterium]
MSTPRERYDALRALGLKLDLTRGQPGDDNFDLSNAMLTIVDDKTLVTPSGVALRNYPGGVAGLKEARELFAPMLGVAPDEIIVGNNASLELEGKALMWAMLRGLPKSPAPWCKGEVKFIVTVPGYDRHFLMLEKLGIGQIPVAMKADGPDIAAIEKLVAGDASIKGLLYVPTHSNPTGDTTSQAVADRLGAMKTAAPDFTIFADDAYAVHHLDDTPPPHPDLLGACKKAGNPTRVILFGSTSKITFAGAGMSFLGGSKETIAWLAGLMGTQMITPNKIEQYRHVLFLGRYPGGIAGIMKAHAKLLAPKFNAVDEILTRELGGKNLATWTKPKGGYFVSLDTAKPVASKVVQLAKEAGVALTPAGATYPFGKDPNDRNIRLSPTRPPVDQVRKAMEVVAVCVQLASE